MDIEKIRDGFPYLKSEENKNLIYLDNAATSQIPQTVLDAMLDYEINRHANPHRGAYKLSNSSTSIYENTRAKVASFINAEDPSNIIFVRNTTEAINLVVYSYALNNLKKGDEVLISIAEHHSNLVNWQFVCEKTGAVLRYFYLDENYNFDLNDYRDKLNENTKIVAFTAASNVLSFKVPIKEMVELAKEKGAVVVLDGAQYTAHNKVDVRDLACDFYAFSGHKFYAPMGVGVLYGKKGLLDAMPPFLYGGDMIEYVHEDRASFAPSPEKFEAGTQNVLSVAGLSRAIDFIEEIGIENIRQREEELTEYCLEKMRKLDYIDLYYPKANPCGSNIAFNVKGVHPHDVASILDYYNVAVRAGHHCTQPLHRYLGINFSCRASIAFFNTREEIDKFIQALDKVKELMISGA